MMNISDQIPHMPMSHVTDFLLIPAGVQTVKETPAGPTLVTTPNPRHWVSDAAIERSRRLWVEKDEAMKRVRKG